MAAGLTADVARYQSWPLNLLWIACGKEDRLMQNCRLLVEVLEQRGIRHEFHETEGNHSAFLWLAVGGGPDRLIGNR